MKNSMRNYLMMHGVYLDNTDCKWHICQNLLSIYRKGRRISSDEYIFELLTLIYVNKKDKFYFEHFSKQLPKGLSERYDSAIYTVPKKNELEAIGFIDYEKINPLIQRYNEYSEQVIYQKYLEKIRNIADSSSINDIVEALTSFKSILFDISSSKEDVIKIETLDKILKLEKNYE